MINRVLATYPFYLIEDRPFMRVGNLQAAVYWGAPTNSGTCPPFKVGGDLVTPEHSIFNDAHNADYWTNHYHALTDVVLCGQVFDLSSYTIDLARQTITFYDRDSGDLAFSGKKVYLRKEYAILPFANARVGPTDLILQVDIGDPVSILHPELLAGLEPTGTYTLYINEDDPAPTTLPLYEVQVRLSYDVTLTLRARPMSAGEEAAHIALGTHGCIGVDLIRNHAVTYNSFEWEPRAKKHYDVFYFNPLGTRQ